MERSEFNKQNQMKKKLTNPIYKTYMKSALPNSKVFSFFELSSLKLLHSLINQNMKIGNKGQLNLMLKDLKFMLVIG